MARNVSSLVFLFLFLFFSRHANSKSKFPVRHRRTVRVSRPIASYLRPLWLAAIRATLRLRIRSLARTVARLEAYFFFSSTRASVPIRERRNVQPKAAPCVIQLTQWFVVDRYDLNKIKQRNQKKKKKNLKIVVRLDRGVCIEKISSICFRREVPRKMAHFGKFDEKHPYYAIAAFRMSQRPEVKTITLASIYWKFAAHNFIHNR